MDPFGHRVFDRALRPLSETLAWRQDRAPHKRGSFRAVVLQGAVDGETAGHPRGSVPADEWTVHLPYAVALAAEIAPGDTISRLGLGAEELAVQEVVPTPTGYLFRCTAKMRPARS